MSGDRQDSLRDCVAALVDRLAAGGKVVVDLAPGDRIAEAITTLGLFHLGVHADPCSAQRMAEQGAEVVTGQLSDPATLFATVERAVGGRGVAALYAGGAVDLATAPAMAALRDLSVRMGSVPLVVHAANVTRLDVAAKLLMGRWDPAALSSPDGPATLSAFFSDELLAATMARAGWSPVDVEDFAPARAAEDDRADVAPLDRRTAAGAHLARIREAWAPFGQVERFVRAYLPTTAGVAVAPSSVAGNEPETGWRPFLSVLVRTRGIRPETLEETLLTLAAQTCDDFEVLVLVHDPAPGAAEPIERAIRAFHPSFAGRVRLVEVSDGGRSRPLNVGAGVARGRYLAMLDDDDLAFAHWVEAFKEAADRAPGRVVRACVASQQVARRAGAWDGADGYDVVSRPRVDYPIEFDHVAHLRDNLTPNNGYAFPRTLVCELHQGWDESLPVLEDWEHLLRAASICGVESCPTVSAMLRAWVGAETSKTAHSVEEWEATRQRIVERFDSAPLLLDHGYTARLRAHEAEHHAAEVALVQRTKEVQRLTAALAATREHLEATVAEGKGLRAQRDDAERRLAAVYDSNSWRVMSAARRGARVVRWCARFLGDRPSAGG